MASASPLCDGLVEWVTGSRSPVTSLQPAKLFNVCRDLLAAEHRGADGFGLELIMTRARTTADIVETIERWTEAGGSHVSIVTMKVGLDGFRAHVGHLADVKAALDIRFGS